MAKEGAAAPSEPAVQKPSGLGMSPLALVVPLLNTLALMATLGVFYYARVKYKRPSITEETEKVRLTKLFSAAPQEVVSALVEFEPTTVNIASNPTNPHPADGTPQQIQGKLHYATLGFFMEIRDRTKQELVESARPAIMDHLILLLGKKQFHELTTVQGRYILHAQIMEFTNHLIATVDKPGSDPLVTQLYFTQFLVQ